MAATKRKRSAKSPKVPERVAVVAAPAPLAELPGTQERQQGALDDRGLRCPDCGCRHLFVVETRQTYDHRIRRLRECRHCGRTFTTYERIAGA